MSRDSVEEKGEENLYGFLSNNAIRWVDLLGRYHVGDADDDGSNTVVTDGLGGLIIQFGDNAKDTSPCVLDSIRVHEGVHRLQALKQNLYMGYVMEGGEPKEPHQRGRAVKPDTLSEQIDGELDACKAQLAFLNKLLEHPDQAKCDCNLDEVRREIKFVEKYQAAFEKALLDASKKQLDGPPKEIFKKHQNAIQIR